MDDRNSSDRREVDTEDPVFYYSREHRLERASPAVRALYDENAQRPGMMKSLVGRRSNIFLLVAILMVCVMFVLSSRFPGAEKSLTLGGNTVAIAIAPNAGGKLSVSIQKTIPSSGEVYTGAVDIAVSPVILKKDKGKTPEIHTERFFFTPEEEEEYRFDLPLEGEDFLVVLQTETERKGLRIKTKKAP